MISFPLSDAPAPAPAALTHCWLVMNGVVWSELPSLMRAISILKHGKIIHLLLHCLLPAMPKKIGLLVPEIALRVTYFALLSLLVEIGPLLICPM
jgi:hypothetical protein